MKNQIILMVLAFIFSSIPTKSIAQEEKKEYAIDFNSVTANGLAIIRVILNRPVADTLMTTNVGKAAMFTHENSPGVTTLNYSFKDISKDPGSSVMRNYIKTGCKKLTLSLMGDNCGLNASGLKELKTINCTLYCGTDENYLSTEDEEEFKKYFCESLETNHSVIEVSIEELKINFKWE